jgi:hypothetical protein
VSAAQIVLLVVGILVIVVVIQAVLTRWVRRRTGELLETVPGTHRSPANFFGVTSRGRTQNRGNGGLALTDAELVFVPMVGQNGVAVPLHAVTRVDTCRSHLGKTMGRTLLRVTWRTPEGEDSGAWLVRDVDAWVEHVANAARRAGASLA